MPEPVIIIGAGGHGKVVADIFQCQGIRIHGFLDDNVPLGTTVLALPIVGKIDDVGVFSSSSIIIAVGDNTIRRHLVQRIETRIVPEWAFAAHPRAIVAASATLDHGSMIVAGAIVNPDCRIGRHTIINTGATVDHDCTIGDFVHIAPGVHLAGDVTVGDGTFIGIGAIVIPGRRIGRNAIIGAGAVVIHDVPDGVIAKGIPARWESL